MEHIDHFWTVSDQRFAGAALQPPIAEQRHERWREEKVSGSDIWVRRHIPATLARIPCQQSLDILVDTLDEDDSFLRFKSVTGIQRLKRENPSLTFKRDPIEGLLLKESRKYFNRLRLHHNLFVRAKLPKDSVLSQAIEEKIVRTVDRIYRLLALIYPWKDVAAARWAIERGDNKARANALEYLDLVQGLFRTLAERRQVKPGFIKAEGLADLEKVTGDLTPIQKVLALQRIPLFSKVSGTEMLYLSAIARQITRPGGPWRLSWCARDAGRRRFRHTGREAAACGHGVWLGPPDPAGRAI